MRTVHRKENWVSSIDHYTNLTQFAVNLLERDLFKFITDGTCDGLILHMNSYSGCPLWPIFTSLPCTGQTPANFLVTKISHFTGSTHASGDLYPVGLAGIWKCFSDKPHPWKVFKEPDMEPRGGSGRGEWLGQRPHQAVSPSHAINLLLIRGGFDRQPIAKSHKNKPVFQIFALSNTLPWIFWFEDWKYTREHCEKSHTSFVWAATRHPRWGCCEATSILGLNLKCAPFSSHFAPEHHPLPTAVSGLTWDWHLHVHAYRCNQTIPRPTRTPWPWRNLLVCWWPGTFKNTSRCKKKK